MTLMSLASGGALSPEPTDPCPPATIQRNGLATSQLCQPLPVRAAVEAGNRIRKKPYVYGGGHGSFNSRGYDCSGSVSYVLHGAGVLDYPLSSGPLSLWGIRGRGSWITVYANAGHAYVTVAGIRMDTSGGAGPRWQPLKNTNLGYRARHPSGL